MDINRDTAIVNIPLSKRGDIDSQIDKYKAEQKKLQQKKLIDQRESFKSDKKIAQELFRVNKKGMLKRYGKLIKVLEDWVKWEPHKAIGFIKMYLDGK